MKKLIIALCLGTLSLQAGAQTEPALFQAADKTMMTHWVDSVFDSLSPEERIGQLFMVIADPSSNTRNMNRLLTYVKEQKIGGILYHTGNPVTQATVTNKLQETARVPLLVALDGEWGLSMRLTGTPRFPQNMMLGAIEDISLLRAYGEEVGRQCREMGIHINFAPVLDVNSNTGNPVIGLRSYGEDPQAVAERGSAYAAGIESAGIISVAKHFPGHGDTFEDSHYTLPSVFHDRVRLDSIELPPFRRYISDGYAGVMTGHLYVPVLGRRSPLPTSLNKEVVTGLLQEELGFRGLTFTDALAMKGASVASKDTNSCVLALLAGNDVLLAPANPARDFTAVKEAIASGVLDVRDIESKCIKILQYKYIAGLSNYRPVEIAGLQNRINTSHAAYLVNRLNAEGLTLLKNDNDILPVRALARKKIAALAIGESEGNPFQTMLNRYDSVACFQISRTSSPAEIARVYKQLNTYDLILCSVHTVRIPENDAFRKLTAAKPVVLTFFTLPYYCKEYAASINNAKGMLVGYENTDAAQTYAAQLIFGGIAGKGKLSVTIPDLYFAGSGLTTEPVRLGYQEPEAAGLDPAKLAEIDSIVQEGLRAKAFPGCQVLVAKDGQIIYNKSFGYYTYDNLQPVTERAVYDLASSSKAAGTVTALMKAYEKKGFTLNSRLAEFVPSMQNSNKKDIRIRDLLYHESGLVPSITFYTSAIDSSSFRGSLYSPKKDAAHPRRFDANSFVNTTFRYRSDLVSDTLRPGFSTQVARNFYLNNTFRDTIFRIIAQSPLQTPGKYLYSCINFILLQQVAEQQMQMPLNEILGRYFTAPLGAGNTLYNPLTRIDSLWIVPTEDDFFVRRQLLRGYVHDEAAAFMGGVSGNAGLFSNANDLAKLLQMLLNEGVYGGERYLQQETLRLFTQSKTPNSHRGLGYDKPWPENPRLSSCGLLAPRSVYGHTGYTGTCFWIDPDNRLIYIFLSNRVHSTRANNSLAAMNIRTRIQDAIYKSFNGKSKK